MKLEVLGFGKIAGITGSKFLVEGVSDSDSLRLLLEQRYPLLKETKYLVAIDKKMTHENTGLNEGSVVALLPPFSGG